MEEDDIKYQEYRLFPLSGHIRNIDQRHWSVQASVAFEIDDSTTGWSRHPRMCAPCIIMTSIISIREGFLPDYLQRLLANLRDISDLLDEDEQVCYRDDLRTLEVLMQYVPYKIIDTGHDWDGIEDSIPPAIRKQ